MSTISEIIYPSETHTPTDTDPITRVGDKFAGDGYYNRSDGLHTVQWSLDEFAGKIQFQASLMVDPQEDDWFTVGLGFDNQYTVDTSGLVSTLTITTLDYTDPTTGAFNANFVGNYVWVRVNITDWTTGSINQIVMSR